MKNIFKLVGIIAVVTIIGFSFAACSNGSTDPGGATVASKWHGTYGGDGGTMTIAADKATNSEGEHPIYSDEGTTTDDYGECYEYRFKYKGSATLMTLYFYDDDPDYLTYGGTKYEKQ